MNNPRFHPGPACSPGQPRIVFGLEIELKLRSHVEMAAQAESGVSAFGGDGPFGAHDGGCARRLSVGVLGIMWYDGLR